MNKNLGPLALSLLLVGCPRGVDPDCTLVEEGHGSPGETAVTAEVVVSGLDTPWSIAFLSATRLLVTERDGRVRLVEDGVVVGDPVLDIDNVYNEGEAGLLGIALHPEFESNRQFFLYVTFRTEDAPENRIERYLLADDDRSATFDKVIFEGIPAAQIHDGGRLRFGPDGMLYAGTGDAFGSDRAQDMSVPSGKLLRLTPDGDIPDDNPFEGTPFFLIGIRNTQGFDWIDDDTLALCDHGPSGDTLRVGHDEVNVARGGDNLGWPTIYACEADPAMVSPALTFTDATPPGGLAVYRGDLIPEWRGDVFVGVLGARHLQRVRLDDDGVVVLHETYFLGDEPEGFGRLRDVINGPDGALWVTTSNCDGRGSCPSDGDKILRIVSGS